MSAYLKYPDLNIEIICEDGYTKVRDLGTGEEREMTTSTAGIDRPNTDEKAADQQRKTQKKT